MVNSKVVFHTKKKKPSSWLKETFLEQYVLILGWKVGNKVSASFANTVWPADTNVSFEQRLMMSAVLLPIKKAPNPPSST